MVHFYLSPRYECSTVNTTSGTGASHVTDKKPICNSKCSADDADKATMENFSVAGGKACRPSTLITSTTTMAATSHSKKVQPWMAPIEKLLAEEVGTNQGQQAQKSRTSIPPHLRGSGKSNIAQQRSDHASLLDLSTRVSDSAVKASPNALSRSERETIALNGSPKPLSVSRKMTHGMRRDNQEQVRLI